MTDGATTIAWGSADTGETGAAPTTKAVPPCTVPAEVAALSNDLRIDRYQCLTNAHFAVSPIGPDMTDWDGSP